MDPRPDAPLIRHLTTTHTVVCGQSWQQLPYVLLPGDGFVEYLLEWTTREDPDRYQVGDLDWPDVVFDFQQGRRVIFARSLERVSMVRGTPLDLSSIPDRGRCLVRVTDGPTYLARMRTHSPWLAGPVDLLAPFRAEAQRWIALESWESSVQLPGGGTGYPAYPDVSILRKDAPRAKSSARLFPNPECRSGRAYGAGFCALPACQFVQGDPRQFACVSSEVIFQTGDMLAVSTLAYLAGMDQYLVEVTPPALAGKRGEGTSSKKPWTLPRPHWILLDPQRAAEYGQPGAAHGEGEASGTKRPHARRGHWRTLHADRFERAEDGTPRRVRVRPAWIGPESWEAEGTRYKVVPPRQ